MRLTIFKSMVWPAGCMLGDGARDSASFDPQHAWVPFCDVICIRSMGYSEISWVCVGACKWTKYSFILFNYYFWWIEIVLFLYWVWDKILSILFSSFFMWVESKITLKENILLKKDDRFSMFVNITQKKKDQCSHAMGYIYL